MTKDWQDLTRLVGDKPFLIQRVTLPQSGIAIEGEFDVPPLARLSAEDQVFVAAFISCHGSIKQMEQYFGISYPTVKNRLNRIGARLHFVEIEPAPETESVLDKLDRGEISVDEALKILKKGDTNV